MVESESMQPPYLTLIELSTEGMGVMKNTASRNKPVLYMGGTTNQLTVSMLQVQRVGSQNKSKLV